MAPGAPSSPAAQPEAAARPVRSAPGAGLTAGPALPLAFIGAGLACLVVAITWSALQPGLAAAPYPHPHLVALLHLWLPGFLLTVCLGAVYQLMPVILGAKLAGPRAAWVHLGLHLAGLALLVPGLATGRYLLAAGGGGALVAGAVIAWVIVARTFGASARRDAVAACFPLAATWLLVTFTAGIIVASNRHHPWLPVSVLALLGAHAHLGLAGFFVTLLQGATFQLVPMFTLGELRRPRWIAAGLGGAQLGLLTLAAGLASEHQSLTRSGAVLLVAGLACSGHALRGTLATRRRRQLETPLRAFLLGLGLLAVAAGLGVASRLLGAGFWPSMGAASRYGLLLIPGALTLAVLGMLLKIVPFLTWMQAYGPQVGRRAVPRATDLSHPGLERTWLVLHLSALACLFAGTFVAGPGPLTRVGPGLLLLAITVFGLNAGRIVRHLAQPPSLVP